MIAMMGVSPLQAYGYLLRGAVGSQNSVAETAVKAIPLIFTGLSYAFAYRCGLINIGAEGQLYMGGLGAAVAGIYLNGLPAVIHIPVALAAGFLAGALWGYVPGLLKARLGVSEVINTIMMTYIAQFFVGYMVTGPIKEPGYFPQTALIRDSAVLPKILPPTRLHLGLILGLLAVAVFWLILWRTPYGFAVRAVGQNTAAAEAAGIVPGRTMASALAIAGGFAGLAGSCEILGIQLRLLQGFSPGYGWDGIAVGLLGRATPLGVLAAALFFGGLRAGGNMMQRGVGVPVAVIYVIQAIIIIVVVASMYLKPGQSGRWRWLRRRVPVRSAAGAPRSAETVPARDAVSALDTVGGCESA
ncbi:MAG TPA: ABC transporter permease [Firmicutes bacterium]|nr:ABC transporter permease [Bacillota bacterium]